MEYCTFLQNKGHCCYNRQQDINKTLHQLQLIKICDTQLIVEIEFAFK